MPSPIFNAVRRAREPERAHGAAPPRCEGCGLRAPACLCASVTPARVRTRVVLLMHHTEIRKSTNTGRLVALGVDGVELRLRGGLHPLPRPALPEGRRLLLFPHPDARELSAADAKGPPVVLLVPDGTWKQAQRVLARDPDAQGAEPVTLPAGPASRYELRRAPREGAVSTLEAVARALGVLEGGEVERGLRELLARFVARSHEAAGRASR
jgi:DTW domain-containing protein YfiP